MATPGANLQFGSQMKTRFKILKKLGLMPNMKIQQTARFDVPTALPRVVAVGEKAGAPVTNTAADAPTGIGDIIYDSTNNAIYRCTAYTNAAVFTWTQIA